MISTSIHVAIASTSLYILYSLGRVHTQFFVILSYTNLYDYPGLGLVDFVVFSCMYMDCTRDAARGGAIC